MGICFIFKLWELTVSFNLVGMFNSNNINKLLKSIDTFYAEATGEYARQLPVEIDTTVCHSVQLQMSYLPAMTTFTTTLFQRCRKASGTRWRL